MASCIVDIEIYLPWMRDCCSKGVLKHGDNWTNHAARKKSSIVLSDSRWAMGAAITFMAMPEMMDFCTSTSATCGYRSMRILTY